MSIGSTDRNDGGSPGARPVSEWLTRALLIDPAVPDPAAACWADARTLGLAGPPILLGWRRGGGPFVAGTSEGIAGAELLAATLELADSTAGWTAGRWSEAFDTFWSRADRPLRDALARRLPLPESERWTLTRWAEAVWGSYAWGEESAIALVARGLAPEVRASLEWLGRRTGSAAGYAAESLDDEGRRIRCFRVAGSLDSGEPRPLPGEVETRGREGVSPDDPFETLERIARDAGATASWSRRDWVRFRGAGGTVRVFPHRDAVWLQLVGADEGTLAGLRYRHGVPLQPPGGPDAPPGAHLVLRNGTDITPGVVAVVTDWLRGEGD